MAKRKRDGASEEPADPRVQATKEIGGYLVAALAISIPLVAILENPLVVAMVVAGAAVATAGVWFFGNTKAVETKSHRIAELESTIEDLKERLENVEVINRYETSLAERALEEKECERPRTMGPAQTEKA